MLLGNQLLSPTNNRPNFKTIWRSLLQQACLGSTPHHLPLVHTESSTLPLPSHERVRDECLSPRRNQTGDSLHKENLPITQAQSSTLSLPSNEKVGDKCFSPSSKGSELEMVAHNLICVVCLNDGEMLLEQVKREYQQTFSQDLPHGNVKLKKFILLNFGFAFTISSDKKNVLKLTDPYKSMPPSLFSLPEYDKLLRLIQNMHFQKQKLSQHNFLCNQKISQSNNQIAKLEKKLHLSKEDQNKLKSEVVSMKKELSKTEKINEKNNNLKSQVKNQQKALIKSRNELKDEREKSTKKITELNDEIARLRKRVAQAETNSDLTTAIPKFMSQNNISNWQVEKLVSLEETLHAASNQVAEVLQTKRSEESLCCACLHNQKNILLLPCKHLCLCEPCSNTPSLRACPLCNTAIHDKLKVYA